MFNMFNEKDLLQLWGKSDGDDESNWHPLLFHLLDVGNVTMLLWEHVLTDAIKRRIAASLGISKDESGIAKVRRIVILLAAQHDLGKASSFQTKVPSFWCKVRDALGVTLPDSCPTPPHGFVTTKALPGLIASGIGGWNAPTQTAKMLARITGGHHGKFPAGADLLDTQIGPASLGDSRWDDIRAELLRRVERHLFPEIEPNALPITLAAVLLRDAAIVPLVGGLISVADWIGSSQEYFAPIGREGHSIAAYTVKSKERAEKALREMGWTPKPSFAEVTKFEAIFPFDPNPMQERVARCADIATAPYMLIVEAAMGEGKTEAALYAIDRALATGLANGFYLALPTQATGNAMFRRVVKYMTERGHGGDLNLQLAHGGSFLSDDLDRLKDAAFDKLKMGRIYGDGSDTDSGKSDTGSAGRLLAETWFTYRKRPLLAPFGVGTIDASLVGILQTKHWFVRLFGLAGKVIVFDEVHAYDIYMSKLLGRLLGWLRILGCTVILLSATLPEKKRRELIEAWDSNAPTTNEAEYPRVTMVGGIEGDVAAQAWTVGQTNPEKTIDVAYCGLEFTRLAETLISDLPDGGCAALICNTVGRAQEAYQTLTEELGPKGWTVLLFHARTLAKWRQETEKAVLARFGKEGTTSDRQGKTLLIGTQVMEQSLDLDFDWMASEIAPIDLLLQRMGRLWRHLTRTNRAMKDGSPKRFYVLCGDKCADEPPELPPYTNWVYEKYVLLRTRLALKAGGLRLPHCIEPLIKAVYDDPNPVGLSEVWQSALTESWERMELQSEKEAGKAEIVMVAESGESVRTLLSPGADAGSVAHEVYDDEDPRVHPDVRATTRLGDPSISVICFGTDDKGQSLADLTIQSREPSKWDARALLGFGLSINHRGLFQALKDTEPPATWKESPYLRFHRAIHFENGVTPEPVGGYILRLSRVEGLRIEKEGRMDEE